MIKKTLTKNHNTILMISHSRSFFLLSAFVLNPSCFIKKIHFSTKLYKPKTWTQLEISDFLQLAEMLKLQFLIVISSHFELVCDCKYELNNLGLSYSSK